MKEQFVTYEIALKLKELGFDEPCLSYWFTVKGNNPQISKNDIYFNGYKNYHDGNTIAPLWQQVIDWFRENHNMYIEITYEGGLQKDTSLYSFQIWSNQTSNKSDKMNYYKAREAAILKAIELCQKEK